MKKTTCNDKIKIALFEFPLSIPITNINNETFYHSNENYVNHYTLKHRNIWEQVQSVVEYQIPSNGKSFQSTIILTMWFLVPTKFCDRPIDVSRLLLFIIILLLLICHYLKSHTQHHKSVQKTKKMWILKFQHATHILKQKSIRV